ncbi:RING-type E3 ubiquitin-protein ligase PPIL2 [Monodelphis domestica]|uniref:RING-type E3 ubiquitin-protein ligase PPIL2 n=1 Tax=Monodelphis domestica TaxID=13616 RepID=F6U4X7_MONDO|nr:RING-type E3 ubiquitin-protein ligase PPIL2 [Monodelphis domestica]
MLRGRALFRGGTGQRWTTFPSIPSHPGWLAGSSVGHPGNGAARAAGGQSVQCYEELVPEELGRESELGVDPRPDPAAAMGKRQHQKDKMYITCAEYTHFYGGKKPDLPQANFRRLPFDHCSLSLQPFEYPVCTPDGVVFDLLNIVPWIKKYGTNPSTGEKLDAKSLIKLNFTKNNEGKYHCPVLFTVFTNNSHIVAIRSTGNVYAYEAVEQLNIKTKNYKDLLTDEAFSRQDIVTLQDPTNLDKFNVANFYHVKNNLRVVDPDEEKARQDPNYYLKNTNAETRETLQELYKDFKGDEILAATMRAPEKKKVDKLNAAHYSTGKVSASFTSTAMVPETTHEAAAIDDDVVRYRFVKKKGYVRLHTNKGDLNLELHCDMTPKTCENFIKLCKKNYYNGTIFHRSIRNFVIQGGDPTGTGTGGESYWGRPFRDEFRPNLSHTGRGILSMANSGPNCNKSQFFITFRSCAYLDKKHTIFGRVVGGFDTLTALENVESDPKTDRPKEEIRIESATVFVDPYEEADAQVAEEREKTRLEEETPKVKAKAAQPTSESSGPRAYRQGVGKYISPEATKRALEEEPSTSTPVAKKKPSRGFGDFSSW